jgi:hypothetical protein
LETTTRIRKANAATEKSRTTEDLEDRVTAYIYEGGPLDELAETLQDFEAFAPVVFRKGRIPYINDGVLTYLARLANRLIRATERFRDEVDLRSLGNA